MKYTPSTESIPQSSRRAVNEKLLYLIDNNCCEAYGITKQDVFQGYTGDGGLHGLSRKNYRSYHTYSEAKKELERKSLPDMIERILFVADFIIEHFKKNLDDLKIVQRNFSWPLVLRKMNEAQDNTLLQMLEQCFCSPYLSRYTIEEAYRMMFLIVEMVGSICYTSILLEQPAPIDQMKPVLFHTIRKILI